MNESEANIRRLLHQHHLGREVSVDGNRMLNLSSNDYLGLAADIELRSRFLQTLSVDSFLPSSSSSRLLTGNYDVNEELEKQLACSFQREAALTFNSGYHANAGILPAVTDANSLILADKLVHASLIDGIRLSSAKCIRYRHNCYEQLGRLVEENSNNYTQIVIATESIFSMDGDEADLLRLVALKKKFPCVQLYVDEAHAFGVRGAMGLGCAEEKNCIRDIDYLVGTFGKAVASVGAFLVCNNEVRDRLINKMRTFIFTTALPPVCVSWTLFVIKQLPLWTTKRVRLDRVSRQVRAIFEEKGYHSRSTSHIVPMNIGPSEQAVMKAQELQRKGFYVLPIRPPTVPEGTSRIRFSLIPDMTDDEILKLKDSI